MPNDPESEWPPVSTVRSDYQELVVSCYLVVAAYEQYLLDRISSASLAQTMEKLHGQLPPISSETREALREAETPPDGSLEEE